MLDMATTIVSYGTVKKYALRGMAMPEGWFVNAKTGAPITDPNRTAEGLLLPIGGYKGSGLAIMLGLLAGVLNSAAFGRDVIDFNADDASETNTGHFIVRDRHRALHAAGRHSRPRSIAICAICAARSGCPASTRSACRATAAAECRDERLRDGVPIAAGAARAARQACGRVEGEAAARQMIFVIPGAAKRLARNRHNHRL